ncbi:hypothetical protein EPD60_11290 [Flaviaesturariibacter flavus]|uniref:Uncharacterized protein n=1 Tax=Flaviaesturariibacter flavus TaxID=2502780 RepID=A0A4R1BC06_9BACT|nr:hypothetical protein [Flaviaesturariibacter flavus]TCJ14560.1 hypothetical protein EPD60_11290 [Flaviaesturariibacter flavus]
MTRLLLLLPLLCFLGAGAQKIVYSEPDRDETRRTTFEVIGKVGPNVLVYKNIRAQSFISAYDNDMKPVGKERQDYLPEDRLINVDFFPYTDHAWVIYEYQKKNVVYCEAVKVDALGKKVSDVRLVDTAHISITTNNKIYSVISSEDKNRLMVFKINSRNKNRYVLSTLLLDRDLGELGRSRHTIPMEDRDDNLGEFRLDNDGGLVFARFTRVNNDNISQASLLWKPAGSDSLYTTEIRIDKDKMFLDELHIKVDNPNKRYFLTSFYYTKRRGNIEGFYFYVWDGTTQKVALERAVALGDELRRDARGDASPKMAFNDYFIRNIIVKKDGGFIIGSEAYYTTSRLNNWNRWDYLYGPPYGGGYGYYSYSPYNNWYWRNRANTAAVRYHADNITILSFDPAGGLQWSNVIHKEQFDDDSDDALSYQVMNTGGALHFLFNQDEKRVQLLNDYVLSPDGAMNRNPTLKNLDRNFDFLPRYGKQVAARTFIVPCYYRNYICFAKVEYPNP